MEQTGLIYRAFDKENTPYVGSTIKGLEERKKQHERKAKYADNIFHKALLEKGFDAFTWEVLEDNIPESKLLDRERYWANYYNACESGYNGYQIQCFPRNISGENHPMFGKPRSEETKQKIRESNKGKQAGEKNPNYGKPRSEETKKKIREATLGRSSAIKDKHRVYNHDGTYVYR